jgi:hypothetical protein
LSRPALPGASEKILSVALSAITTTNAELPTLGQQRLRVPLPQRHRVAATTTASIRTSTTTTAVAIGRPLLPPISTPLASGEAAPVLDLLIWTTDRWSSHATPSGRVAKLHAFVHEQLDRTGSCHHLVSQIKSMVSQIDQLSSRRASVEEVELVGFSEMQAMVVTTLLFLFSCWHQQVLLLSRRGDARTRGGKLRPRRVHSECGDARFTRWQTARLHQGGQAGDEVAPGWADGQSRSRRATSGRADDEV